jgi:hypothetical protein
VIDEEGAAELAAEIADRVAQRVEAARARRVLQAAERAERTRRRDAGLRSRYAAKTARTVQACTQEKPDDR